MTATSADYLQDHYEGEDVIITFEEEGITGGITNYEGKLTNIDFGGGTQSTEDIFAFGSKTFNFTKPREKFTVGFDFVTADAKFAHIVFGGTYTTPAGTEVRSSATANRWRVILWFQKASQHVANSTNTIIVPKKTSACFRIIFADCKAVEKTYEMAADGIFKGKISFEISATDSNGYANIFEEYTTSTTTALTILNATAHKGLLTWNATTPHWTGAYRP